MSGRKQCAFLLGSHVFQFVDYFQVEKLSLRDVLRHLPRVFESYDRRSKFDSVLHMGNDNVLYGFSAINPFRHSFSEPKCARGGHIIFLESIFQHSPHEIVIYCINRKSYNKKVNIL